MPDSTRTAAEQPHSLIVEDTWVKAHVSSRFGNVISLEIKHRM